MAARLTARQYTVVRCLLIIAHALTFIVCTTMLIVPLIQRHRYLHYFVVVPNPDLGVSLATTLMALSGSVGLVQPLLFFFFYIVYPLLRERWWSVQARRLERSSATTTTTTTPLPLQQPHDAPEPPLLDDSAVHQNALIDLMHTSDGISSDSHTHTTQHAVYTAVEVEGEVANAADSGTAREAAVQADAEAPFTGDADMPVPSTGGDRAPASPHHPLTARTASLLSLTAWSDAPLLMAPPSRAAVPPSPLSDVSTAPRRSDTVVVPRGSSFQPFSLHSGNTTEADVSAVTAVPSAAATALQEEAMASVSGSASAGAVAVPIAHRSTAGHPSFYVSQVPQSTAAVRGGGERGVAANGADDDDDDMDNSSLLGSGPNSPLSTRVNHATVEAPSGGAAVELDRKASRRARRVLSDTVTPRALAMLGDSDGGGPVVVRTATPSVVKSVTDPFRTPLATRPGSSVWGRTLPLRSMRPSDAEEMASVRHAYTEVSSVALSKRSAGLAPTVTPTAAVSRAASVHEMDAVLLSSEEVRPAMPRAASTTGRRGRRRPRTAGDVPRHSDAVALVRPQPCFAPLLPPKEASAPPAHEVAAPLVAEHDVAPSQPLSPALLHSRFTMDMTFRLLLSIYYIVSAMSILSGYVLGIVAVVRSELTTVNDYYSMADGWNNVFIFKNVSAATDAAMCRLQLSRDCSGGGSLCNASAYASADDAHSQHCPFCTARQQRTISTYTRLCSSVYDPGLKYYRTYMVLLAIAIAASLAALWLAVYSCGAGVLPSVGYASPSQRGREAREAREAQEAQEAAATVDLLSSPESLSTLRSLHSPTDAISPLFYSTLGNGSASPSALAAMTATTAAPSRAALAHMFEGLHAPSTAMLPSLSVVMAEMSRDGGCGDSGDAVLPRTSPLRERRTSGGAGRVRDLAAHSMVDGVDDTSSEAHTRHHRGGVSMN
ncbi:hypothetical protein NESM_000201900 [Novymonas esmeraldas]|uniref:Integral membrane protein n=1 Tax=Novymonas esmeraldas TaxID=1808958 RepID=A0AAW0F6R6_9TRYP